jgi:hypothetical protein
MATARVAHLLDEIAQLSSEEQAELMRVLPPVLGSGRISGDQTDAQGHLSLEAVQRAVETRERIRRRLDAEAQSSGSISADLDEVRDSRLDELLGDDSTQDQAQ